VRDTKRTGRTSLHPQPFDYAALPPPDREFITEQTGAIQSLAQRAAEDIIDIGRRLLAVKDRLPHGHFNRWLQAEFAMSARTAQNFMKVARVFKSETVSLLETIPRAALYMLAAPSVSEGEREEFLRRLETGEPVTVEMTRTLLRGFPKGTAADALQADLRANAQLSLDAEWRAEMAELQDELPPKGPVPFAAEEHAEIAEELRRREDWFRRFALRLEKCYPRRYAAADAHAVARKLGRLRQRLAGEWDRDGHPPADNPYGGMD
jgi:hypothetical protein